MVLSSQKLSILSGADAIRSKLYSLRWNLPTFGCHWLILGSHIPPTDRRVPCLLSSLVCASSLLPCTVSSQLILLIVVSPPGFHVSGCGNPRRSGQAWVKPGSSKCFSNSLWGKAILSLSLSPLCFSFLKFPLCSQTYKAQVVIFFMRLSRHNFTLGIAIKVSKCLLWIYFIRNQHWFLVTPSVAFFKKMFSGEWISLLPAFEKQQQQLQNRTKQTVSISSQYTAVELSTYLFYCKLQAEFSWTWPLWVCLQMEGTQSMLNFSAGAQRHWRQCGRIQNWLALKEFMIRLKGGLTQIRQQ